MSDPSASNGIAGELWRRWQPSARLARPRGVNPRVRTVVALMLAVLGGLLTFAAAFLPWTQNSILGNSTGITQMWAVFVAVLVLEALAVTLLTSRRPGLGVVAAGLALLVVIIAMEATPLGVVMWDGVDKFGRPVGGMERSTLGYGATVALVGVLIHLAGPLLAVAPTVRTRLARRHRAVAGPAGVRTPTGPARTPDGPAAPDRE